MNLAKRFKEDSRNLESIIMKTETLIHLMNTKPGYHHNENNDSDQYLAATQEVLEHLENFKNINFKDMVDEFWGKPKKGLFEFFCTTKKYMEFLENLKSFSKSNVQTNKEKYEHMIIQRYDPYHEGRSGIQVSLLDNLGTKAREVLKI